jgi:hypothetical protein
VVVRTIRMKNFLPANQSQIKERPYVIQIFENEGQLDGADPLLRADTIHMRATTITALTVTTVTTTTVTAVTVFSPAVYFHCC